MRNEFPDSQPKYSLATTIPAAGTGRMRSPYPKGDLWYYTNEATEKLLVPYQTYRSGELSYIDGSSVIFTHDWVDFNPATDWYEVSAWAVCIQSQSGWSVGERIKLNGRRCTISVNETAIALQIGSNGISAGRKNGNLNEFNLNPSRWRLYIQAKRKTIEN